MNPWDKDAPWINALRISKEAKQALWTQVKAGNVTENEAESYNWGVFTDIANFMRWVKAGRVEGTPVGDLKKAQTDIETIRKRIDTTDATITSYEEALVASKTDNIKIGKRTLKRDKATADLEKLRDNRKFLSESLDDIVKKVNITNRELFDRQQYADSWWQRYERTKNVEDFKQWQIASAAVGAQAVSARPITTTKRKVATATDGKFIPPVPMGVVPTGSVTGNKGGTGATGGTGSTVTKPPVKPEEPTKPPVTGSIFDELAALFPAYRDWTEEAATAYFGADLIDVFRKASTGFFGVGKEKDTAAIKRAIEGTNYWRTTTAAIQKWDGLREPDRQTLIKNQKALLAQTFGELQLDDATLTELATTIQRTGLTELGASQLVYGAAFKRQPTATGPQSRQLALESEKADQLRKIARAYGYSPKDLDAQIESVLTGQSYLGGAALTDAALRERAEKAARGAFPHLKDQFDSGLTLEDMFGNYRDIAVRVLEVDPGTVDFMKDPQKWLKPFGDAKTGQMSLSDWVRELKTNQDYGWRFTNQANQQVSSVVSTLERAFGLIK